MTCCLWFSRRAVSRLTDREFDAAVSRGLRAVSHVSWTHVQAPRFLSEVLLSPSVCGLPPPFDEIPYLQMSSSPIPRPPVDTLGSLEALSSVKARRFLKIVTSPLHLFQPLNTTNAVSLLPQALPLDPLLLEYVSAPDSFFQLQFSAIRQTHRTVAVLGSAAD